MAPSTFDQILLSAIAEQEKAPEPRPQAPRDERPAIHFLATKANELTDYCTVRQYMQNT